MGRKKGFKMSQEQKDSQSIKMKEWAEARRCPECKRSNAVDFFVTMFKCRYCGAEFKNVHTYPHKEPTMANRKVVKYEISNDGVGLLAYFEDGNFYHIHSNELTEEEKAILNSLSKKATTPYQRLVEKGKTYEIRGT